MLQFHLIAVSQEHEVGEEPMNISEKKIIQSSDDDVEHIKLEYLETSSAKCNQGHLLKQPKKGFLHKVNLVLSRMFLAISSKL